MFDCLMQSTSTVKSKFSTLQGKQKCGLKNHIVWEISGKIVETNFGLRYWEVWKNKGSRNRGFLCFQSSQLVFFKFCLFSFLHCFVNDLSCMYIMWALPSYKIFIFFVIFLFAVKRGQVMHFQQNIPLASGSLFSSYKLKHFITQEVKEVPSCTCRHVFFSTFIYLINLLEHTGPQLSFCAKCSSRCTQSVLSQSLDIVWLTLHCDQISWLQSSWLYSQIKIPMS